MKLNLILLYFHFRASQNIIFFFISIFNELPPVSTHIKPSSFHYLLYEKDEGQVSFPPFVLGTDLYPFFICVIEFYIIVFSFISTFYELPPLSTHTTPPRPNTCERQYRCLPLPRALSCELSSQINNDAFGVDTPERGR